MSLQRGRVERDDGMARVEQGDDAAGDIWKDKFRESFWQHLRSGAPFNADNIRHDVGEPPPRPDGSPRPNLVGAMFNGCVRAVEGAIEVVGDTQMTKTRAHARRTPLWQGVGDVVQRDRVVKVESTGRTVTRRCTRTMPTPVALAPAERDLRRHEPRGKRGSAQSKKPVQQVHRDPAPKLTGDALQDYLDKKAGL